MAVLGIFRLMLSLLALMNWIVRIGTMLAAYVGWVAADPLMRRRQGRATGLIVTWVFIGVVVGMVGVILFAGQLRPRVRGDAVDIEPGVVVLVVALVAAIAAVAGPKLSLLAARGWIVARGGETPSLQLDEPPTVDAGSSGPVIEGGRIETSDGSVAVQVPTSWVAIDRTFPGLWEHPQALDIDAFRWADAGFDEPMLPDAEVLVDAWDAAPGTEPPQRLRVLRIPTDSKDLAAVATRARSRLAAGISSASIRILRDRQLELPAGGAAEVSYVVRLTDGSSGQAELRVTELHLLEGAWEYVLEFGGPTAAYNQRSSMARSLELTRA